jgi:hypothetical protein
VIDGWNHVLPNLWEHDVTMNFGWATMRQSIVARLDVAAQTSREWGHLEALGATFGAVAAELRARWGLAGPALSPYPAFSGESPDPG